MIVLHGFPGLVSAIRLISARVVEGRKWSLNLLRQAVALRAVWQVRNDVLKTFLPAATRENWL